MINRSEVAARRRSSRADQEQAVRRQSGQAPRPLPVSASPRRADPIDPGRARDSLTISVEHADELVRRLHRAALHLALGVERADAAAREPLLAAAEELERALQHTRRAVLAAVEAGSPCVATADIRRDVPSQRR
jgi:hypothetical protein